VQDPGNPLLGLLMLLIVLWVIAMILLGDR
jgi:hypothetical protein